MEDEIFDIVTDLIRGDIAKDEDLERKELERLKNEGFIIRLQNSIRISKKHG